MSSRYKISQVGGKETDCSVLLGYVVRDQEQERSLATFWAVELGKEGDFSEQAKANAEAFVEMLEKDTCRSRL